MLVLAVLGLLAMASLAIPISHAFKPSIPRAWVIALSATTIAWLIMLISRLFLPTEVKLLNWSPSELFQGQLNLVLDYQSWPYALALITLCLATIFTDTTRANLSKTPFSWAGSMAIALINIIAVLAANPLTVAFAWALVDLVELIYLFSLRTEEKNNQNLVSEFTIRLLSVLTLVAATVVGWRMLPNFNLHGIPANATWIFLLAASLRLGIFQIRQPILPMTEVHQGITVFLRFAPAASALVLISHLDALPETLGSPWLGIANNVTMMVALYSSLMFATRPNKIQSRPYWIVALSAFSVLCAINGAALTSRVWGLALLLSGAMLYLFEPAVRRIRFLPLLGLIGLVGLPFTLSASGWDGLIGMTLKPSLAIMIISHALLLGGYLRYIFEANTTITALEKHARITFPLGLVFILQTILLLGIVGWPGVLTLGSWWAPAISLGLVGLIILVFFRLGLKLPFTNLEQRLPLYRLLQVALTWIENFFSFNWIYSSLEFFTRQIGRVTNAITILIEGEGGVLWSLIFLIALTAIFVSGVQLP
ncbi:MAG: hypothetical protein WBI14_06055 [Anaerolineaceae bacterium]